MFLNTNKGVCTVIVQTPFLFYKSYSPVYFRVRYWI